MLNQNVDPCLEVLILLLFLGDEEECVCLLGCGAGTKGRVEEAGYTECHRYLKDHSTWPHLVIGLVMDLSVSQRP